MSRRGESASLALCFTGRETKAQRWGEACGFEGQLAAAPLWPVLLLTQSQTVVLASRAWVSCADAGSSAHEHRRWWMSRLLAPGGPRRPLRGIGCPWDHSRAGSGDRAQCWGLQAGLRLEAMRPSQTVAWRWWQVPEDTPATCPGHLLLPELKVLKTPGIPSQPAQRKSIASKDMPSSVSQCLSLSGEVRPRLAFAVPAP